MYLIGRIDKEIYRCITENIITDEVIITENQKKHIFERHSDSYEEVIENIKVTIEEPDYILKDKHPNTGLVVRKIIKSDLYIQVVLRIKTNTDDREYKNSIISSWKISERRLQNYIRNKEVLYKKRK